MFSIKYFAVAFLDMFDQLADEIAAKKPTRVLVQLPEGLKRHGAALAAALKEHGVECVLSNDPCYGACDLKDEDARRLQCDLLVHVGHSKFYRDVPTVVPVMYFPWFVPADLQGVDITQLTEHRIGLLTSIQHLTLLPELKERLEQHGKEVMIGGQILGCWTANADKIASHVDAYLFVGSGVFHPLALSGKPVYVLDIERRELQRLDARRFEAVRWGRIARARDARTFAVLVTSKKGQCELLGRADEIKALLEQHGRRAFVVIMDEITDAKLTTINADAFINTACPRLADDVFSRPFINADDLDHVLETSV